MKYAIIGSGDIGTVLARAFAEKNIAVAIANSRGPETLASMAEKLGASVFPQSVQDAAEAEMVFLAIPFSAHKRVAKQLPHWQGKIIVDAMNTLDLSAEEREALGGVLSSEIVEQAFSGARLVKAFNHLPAGQLGSNPFVEGQRQVVFVSSNDAEASAEVAAVVTELGFAPVELGKLAQGGAALHVLNGEPGGLLFENLVKVV